MAALTLTRLRCLAAAYGKDTPGAREQLDVLARDEHQAVCELLGMSPGTLTADTIARRVRDLTLRAKSEARCRARDCSTELAQQVAYGAQLRPEGSWALPIGPLTELARLGGFTHMELEPLGVVDLRIVKRVVKACKNARLLGIAVSSSHLTLTYDGPASRGRISLVVRGPEPLDDAVVVRIGTRAGRATRGRLGGCLDHLEHALKQVAG